MNTHCSDHGVSGSHHLTTDSSLHACFSVSLLLISIFISYILILLKMPRRSLKAFRSCCIKFEVQVDVLRTWLGSCIEVLLQERHRVDPLGISGRVEKLHGSKLS